MGGGCRKGTASDNSPESDGGPRHQNDMILRYIYWQ